MRTGQRKKGRPRREPPETVEPWGAVERLAFNSDAYPAGERLRRYREFNAPGAQATADGQDFRAVVTRWRLDRAVLHERRLNDVAHQLRPKATALDHFILTLVREGLYEVEAGSGWFAVPPDGAVLIDMTKGMRSRARHAHVVTISLSRDLVSATAGAPEELHGHMLKGAATGLLADFLVALVGRIDSLPNVAGLAIIQSLGPLLSLAAQQSLGESGLASPEELRLVRVRWLIEQQMSDPALDVERISAASGLSRATLYRMFRPFGGLVSYIRRRRLERVRMALADGADTRSLAEIAADTGFPSESHCSRVFASTFGMRPSRMRSSGGDDSANQSRTTRFWLDELR